MKTDLLSSSTEKNEASSSARESSSGNEALLNKLGYQLLSKLGSGGMGTVYLAKQLELDRLVAIKMLPIRDEKSQSIANRFKGEAVTMAALNHPNIVGCYDIIHRGNKLFLIMEFIPGQMSVGGLVKKFGKLPDMIILRILSDVVEGLAYIQSKGYIHYDLKPDNLLVYNEKMADFATVEEIFRSPDTKIKICDFGIARHVVAPGEKSLQTASTEALGSPNYMAPEQIMSSPDLDFRADIYSLGCTAMFMMYGKAPFEINDRDKLLEYKLEHNVPTPGELGLKVNRKLSRIVSQCGRLDPDERYQNYEELTSELEKLADSIPQYTEFCHRKAGKQIAFWKNVCLLMILAIFFIGGYWIREHYEEKYFKEHLISYTSSLAYWKGPLQEWTYERVPAKKRYFLLSTKRTSQPLRLTQQILPGDMLELQLRHLSPGDVQITLMNESTIMLRFNWKRDPLGQDSFFVRGGNQLRQLEQVEYNVEWMTLKFAFHRQSITLYFYNEPVDTIRIGNIQPCNLTLGVATEEPVIFKQVLVYREK